MKIQKNHSGTCSARSYRYPVLPECRSGSLFDNSREARSHKQAKAMAALIMVVQLTRSEFALTPQTNVSIADLRARI
jgi:hypothetical protein